MSPTPTCARCGAPLPAGHPPERPCPACLLAAAQRASRPPTGADSLAGSLALAEPPTPAELAPLFPALEILEVLGQGGMGVVYRARQKELGRAVALKLLWTHAGPGVAVEERFLREARALARLAHPHIVGVHDFGRAGAHLYLVLELVEGESLRQLLARGRVEPAQALAIVAQTCAALQYAHDQGVVHRDVKPENILLDRAGQVKIADFGLARVLAGEAPPARLTRATQAMGTPQYMAPEQIERPLAVDHRADIFSLGVVFYELLTGELPLGRFAPPSRKVEIDVRLDGVVLKALEKEPEQRYQRAAQVRTEVEEIVSRPAAAHAPVPAVPAPAPARRSALPWVLLILFVLLLAPLACLVLSPASIQRVPAVEAPAGPAGR
ncbi:MAG TPA: serine/threonine-protein kinase [Planctomycetota bacterium]